MNDEKKMCEICGKNEWIKKCLGCKKRYCEWCAGSEAGYCKECKPWTK